MLAEQVTQKSFSEKKGPLGFLPLPAVEHLQEILKRKGVDLDLEETKKCADFLLVLLKNSLDR